MLFFKLYEYKLLSCIKKEFYTFYEDYYFENSVELASKNSYFKFLIFIFEKLKDYGKSQYEFLFPYCMPIIKNGDTNILKYLRNIHNFGSVDAAIEYRSYKMIDFMTNNNIQKHSALFRSINVNYYMETAASFDFLEIINYFIALGAYDYERGLNKASEFNNINSVRFFLNKGVQKRGIAVKIALAKGNNRIVKFLRNYNLCIT